MRIFLSSVYKGLQNERENVIDAIRRAGDDAVAMEIFAARPETPREVCLAELRRADVAVVIVGERYGSIEPLSGLSYTHMEFAEAVRLGLPVLPFFLRAPEEGGFFASIRSWWRRLRSRWWAKPSEQQTAGIGAFRSAIRAYSSPEISNSAALPAHVLAAIHRFCNAHGVGGRFRVFQSTEDFFAPFLDARAHFHHDHTMIGRKHELAGLAGFLQSRKLVAILGGAGGVGKSRLLLEAARQAAEDDRLPVFRFVAPEAAISEDSLMELPTVPTCIVVDDAHRRNDLPHLLKACRQQNQGVRFVLTTRPGGLGAVKYAIRGVPESEREMFEELSNLPETDASRLAEMVLGADARQYADALAESAEGNALIVTVGGRAIRDGLIAPQLLARKEAFRRAALDRIIQELPDTTSYGVDARRLLEVLAAIAPISPSSPERRADLARYFGNTESDVARAIQELERYRLVVRRGETVRVAPDVLADHLLFQAAVTEQGESTGFVDQVVSCFGWDLLENTVANAGELEWRSRALGEETKVLDSVWSELLGALPTLTHRHRRDLLQQLERAAIYIPERMLELIEWLLDNSDAPVDGTPELLGFPTTTESVERGMPQILRTIAQHPTCTERAARSLWRLADRPQFAKPIFTTLPINTLRHLAEYRADQRLAVQDGVIAVMEEIVEADLHLAAAHSPSEILAGSLSREGSSERFAGATLTIGRFIIDPSSPVVASMRERALRLLTRLCLASDPKHAVSSLNVLPTMMRDPGIGFPGEMPEETMRLWLQEGQMVTELLVRVALEGATTTVRLTAKKRLLEWREEEWPELAEVVEEARAAIQPLPNESLYIVLAGPIDRELRRDLQELEAEHEQLAAEVAEALWVDHERCSDLLTHINEPAQELERADLLMFDGARRLFRAIGAARPTMAVEMGRELLATELPAVQGAITGVLRSIDDRDVVRQLIRDAMGSDDEIIRAEVAQGLRWLVEVEHANADDLELIRYCLDVSPIHIRRRVVSGLRLFTQNETRPALELIASIDFEGDAFFLNEALAVIHSQYGIHPDQLSDTEIDSLVVQVEQLNSLGDGLYNILEFLQLAASRHPALVADMLLRRIDRALLAPGDGEEKYKPLPHHSARFNLAGLANDPDYAGLLRKISERLMRDEWHYQFWIPRLLAFASVGVDELIDVALEMARTGDPGRISKAPLVLGDLGHGIIYDRHEAVAELLTLATAASADCYLEVVGHLHGIAVTRGYSGSPGQAPPQLVADKERAEALAERYSDTRPVKLFYERLAEEADANIRRSLRRSSSLLD